MGNLHKLSRKIIQDAVLSIEWNIKFIRKNLTWNIPFPWLPREAKKVEAQCKSTMTISNLVNSQRKLGEKRNLIEVSRANNIEMYSFPSFPLPLASDLDANAENPFPARWRR